MYLDNGITVISKAQVININLRQRVHHRLTTVKRCHDARGEEVAVQT